MNKILNSWDYQTIPNFNFHINILIRPKIIIKGISKQTIKA